MGGHRNAGVHPVGKGLHGLMGKPGDEVHMDMAIAHCDQAANGIEAHIGVCLAPNGLEGGGMNRLDAQLQLHAPLGHGGEQMQ